MLDSLLSIMHHYPQIAVFLAIAIGYQVGQIRIYGFSLGSTASVLLAALVIGQLRIDIPSLLKSVAFALFIFTIGYKVGPQFFGSLKREGVTYLILSIFFGIVALATALLLAKGMQFDQGTAAGVLGGALTQSAVIGTADGAISHLSISAAEKTTLTDNVAVAYAITYLFGTAGLIVFFKFLPRLIGIDLRSEAATLAKQLKDEGEGVPELFSWSSRLSLRCYRVTSPNVIGKSVANLEKTSPEQIEIKRIQRGKKLIEATDETLLQEGDLVAIIGLPHGLLEETFGEEVDDQKLRAEVGEIIDVCILNKEIVDGTLGALAKRLGTGIFLKRLTRQGHEMPLAANTIIHSCDLIRIAGSKAEVEEAIALLGYPERSTSTTDLVMVGIGCVLGTLLGLAAVKLGEIPITLGVGGGVLVGGLVAGYLRSLHPTFGQIPSPAQWIFTDLGLNLFIACVGLTAGPKAIDALKQMGPSIFVAGVILSLVPHTLSFLFGRYILRMNPILLLGALTGAGTITAALNALKEESGSNTPALGYTVPYAIGNVILTVWGTLMVYLT